jgi:hypothetical protein
MTMWLLSRVRFCQALVLDSTWRELVRRIFAPDDRQMERYAAELAENAVAEAGSAAGASVVQQLGPSSPLALPAPRSPPRPRALARRRGAVRCGGR